MPRTCEYDGCHTIPNYNVVGETRGRFCATHRQDGMVNVMSRTCEHDGCHTIPSYNVVGETRGRFCATHRQDGMVDVRSRTCTHDWCPTIVNNDRYDGYCVRCFVHLFPDRPIARGYKTKETAVVEHVLREFPGVDWVCDKRVRDGCSLRRPDILLDLGARVLVVEIDEYAHRSYDITCENRRLMELSKDVGHRPLVVIRFNPDGYICGSSWEPVPSCWVMDRRIGTPPCAYAHGGALLHVQSTWRCTCRVPAEQQGAWQARLSALQDAIAHWMASDTASTRTLEQVDLFFS